MEIAPFLRPRPDLGRYIASFVGGTSKYQEASSSDQGFITGEFMIKNLKKKLPLEQLEAMIHEYLVLRGFVDITGESEETLFNRNSSARKYFHPTYSQTDEWIVLINTPTSAKDISVSLSLHPN